MNKYIIKHFGSISSFVLSMIAILLCIIGLYITFCIDEFIGSMILFIALLVISFALRD